MRNKFESLMAKTKKLTLAELTKENDKLYEEKLNREANLLFAFKEKKLKSKALIKEAKKIKAAQQKKKRKANESD